jgi:F-type H+-transporting ATPase subunit b
VNSLKKTAGLCVYALACVAILHLSAFEVLAAENSGDWRPMFDLVMRWFNFLLLAFLLVKFSRAPIKKFLADKKQDIADEIDGLEAEKEEMLGQIAASKIQIENSQARLSELKKRIIAQGEKNRLRIMEEAEQESKMMLRGAQQKIDSRITEARQVLKSELIDAAFDMAIKKLPEKITAEDDQKLIDAFMSRAASK